MNSLEFKSTKELSELMAGLGQDKRFQRFMELLKERADGVAVWAHLLADETQLRWGGGRVQELCDIVRLYEQRHELLRKYEQLPQRVAAEQELSSGHF